MIQWQNENYKKKIVSFDIYMQVLGDLCSMVLIENEQF